MRTPQCAPADTNAYTTVLCVHKSVCLHRPMHTPQGMPTYTNLINSVHYVINSNQYQLKNIRSMLINTDPINKDPINADQC